MTTVSKDKEDGSSKLILDGAIVIKRVKVARITLTTALGSLLLFSAVSQAHSLECQQFLRMHGFASRAQFQCGFNQYSNDVLAQAAVCMKKIGGAAAKKNIAAGMKLFDKEASQSGKTNSCRKVLNMLPMVVKK